MDLAPRSEFVRGLPQALGLEMPRDDTPSTKPLLDKLGVKRGQRISLIRMADPRFAAQIADRAGARPASRVRVDSDLIFFRAEQARDLERLPALVPFLSPDGALWVVRPKGVTRITEAEVMAAGLAAGLVDVKVVAFSLSHTAEKFVFRLADRPKRPSVRRS